MKSGNFSYLKCSKTMCPALRKVDSSKVVEDWEISVTKNHDHEPDPLFREAKLLRKKIIDGFVKTNDDAKLIINHECNR